MAHTNRFILFTTLALAVAAAGTCYGTTPSLPLDQALRLAGGDSEALSHFEQCAEDNHACALLVASHLRNRNRQAEAAEYLQQALRLGDEKAATSLAFMHTVDGRHLEAWAWSYLAYALDDPEETLPKAEAQKLFSVRLLATNQQALDDRKLADAKTRAGDLMTEWWPRLEPSAEAERDEEPAISPHLEIIPGSRSSPEYPRALMRAGVDGFARVYFEVDRHGKVIDAVPVDFSHPAFGNASVNAVKQWRFEVDAPDDRKRYPALQTIEYHLEDDYY